MLTFLYRHGLSLGAYKSNFLMQQNATINPQGAEESGASVVQWNQIDMSAQCEVDAGHDDTDEMLRKWLVQ
jgi:hypothetical protein